ncbi:MAG: transcription elongation factor GreA [Anaerolineae bacterium]|nr:transcription elongation factor GreA [Anaerolineae bacterium]MDW8068609.1 transcription elongation factor GreA [Anaerolineae bacterium]
MEPVVLTAEGMEELRRELDYLVNVRRPELARVLRRAIQQGDLSENADYIAAKEEQAFLEGRIQQIETMLRNAVLIQNNGSTGIVDLGSRVTLLEEGRETPEVFQIVGPVEADPLKGRVSYESPLGRALLGHRAGEVVTVDAPAGPVTFRILEVS